MKTAVFYGKEDVRFEDRPIPTPGKNQMVVKINYVGVCGTDVESYTLGEPIHGPIVLGHENVATITEIGEGVEGFEVGDVVLCGPPTACADMCTPCSHGETNICIHGFPNTAGIGGPDGGYSEYMLIEDVAHRMLIKVPDGVDPKDAVLFDVVCVALHGIRKSKFKIGDSVVVSGTGAIGLSAIQLLKAAGASKIIALGTTPAKFPLLKEYGADYCLNPKELGDDLGAKIREILGRDVGADVVFECAGNMNSLNNCIYHCIKPGGDIMEIGTIGEPMGNLIPATFSPMEVNILTTFVYTREEVDMYMTMLDLGKVKFPNMVSDIISLDDCVEKGLARKEKGTIKILIDPSK